MSMPGGYQPQYQQPYEVPPSDGSGMKTCLIIGGIVGGVFLVFAIACGLSAYFLVSNVKRQATDGIAQFNEEIAKADERRKEAEQRRTAPPANLNAALSDLAGNDPFRHTAALKWLSNQSVDSAQQKKVALALVGLLTRSSSENKATALKVLAKWGDASIAPQLAESLRYRDETTNAKLDLLAKYKDMTTAVLIAAVLEDRTYAAKAKETLKAMGAETAGAVAEYLGSGNANARNYAKELLQEFNVDTNAAIVKLQIERLKGDSTKQREAAKELAALKLDAEQQPAIVKLLNETLNTKDTFLVRDMLSSLLVWGDNSTMEPLVRAIRAEKVASFDLPKAFELMGKFGDETEIPILVEHLPDYGETGKAAVDALIKIGPASAKQAVVHFNSDQRDGQANARRVLAAFDDNHGVIVAQCIEDVKTGTDRVAQTAAKWLAECEVIPDQSTNVTTALAAFIQRGNIIAKREATPALARWATAKQKDLLLTMLEDRDDAIWNAAYKRLLELEAFEELTQPTGVYLNNVSQRRKVGELLRKAGPTAEPLAIAMLGHSEEDALVEACSVLAEIGGEASLKPLADLMKKAQRVGSKKVTEATKKAGTIVTLRVKEAKQDAPAEAPE